MNNYSWLQKKIHKFVLETRFLRETIFEAESTIFSYMPKSDQHIFVCGLARSGTTVLLNALYYSGEFASLCYEDMPFVLAPNLWSKFSFFKMNKTLLERAHGDGIQISAESPEAFEEVFWRTFNEKENSIVEKFEIYVNNVNRKYKKNRYLSKNNQNIKRINLILKIFPKSKIFIPFRSPSQHSYSLCNQHKRFVDKAQKDNFIADYMYWIGHTEFGPNYEPIHKSDVKFKDHLDINHWLEQWYMTYKSCFKLYQNHKNIKFICYENLCNDKSYWDNVLTFGEIENKYSFHFKEVIKKLDVEFDTDLLIKSNRLYEQLSNANY